MAKQITGGEYSLSEIFSSQFDFSIPPYQRPYAWELEQASELFDDLYDFFNDNNEDNYFLGSIVLIKENKVPQADVIDGQQRLTTLTILLAAMTSQLTGEYRSDYEGYIIEPGRASQGLKPNPRLTLREKDRHFFRKYVQELRFDELIKLNAAALQNDAQRNIRKNSKLIFDNIKSKFDSDEAKICEFGRFLMTQCYMVAVSTPNRKSAFRVFSVMNNRGLDLLPPDIIKADVIGTMPEGKQADYTALWEDLEEDLGRDRFNDLFGHIRMIYTKSKAKKEMLSEFIEFVVEKESDPQKLIDDVIEPYARCFDIVSKSSYQSTNDAALVNDNLRWLNRINNADWVPPALVYFSRFRDDSDSVLWFTKKLERLAAFLHVSGKYINHRLSRYGEILGELEGISDPTHLPSIELTEDEKEEFRNVLDGDIYHLTSQRRSYLILKTDAFLSDTAATYDRSLLTLEHVLPQTVNPNSQWEIDFPDQAVRELWTHRIANLAPLTQKRNSKARNFDFKEKKNAYFKGKNEITSFTMTTQIIAESEWTIDVVEQRQADLLELLYEKWELV